MSDPLVTVTAYPQRELAQTAQGALDSAGIDSTIDDAIDRRVKLRVENAQAIRAGDVLTAKVPSLQEIDEADEVAAPLVCPACSSPEVVSAQRAKLFALVAVIAVAIGFAVSRFDVTLFAIAAAAVFLLIAGRWRCESCGETWD
jgi:hypothetical protein